ncbi:alpha/beta fold hydrolase [Micromonospora sp. SH-82]|uniref:alpha/beta fold hydrolase n=1 Tax=Micromonospora sp. SH-82 TaxID=3132938 RepID=UPI003EBC4030
MNPPPAGPVDPADLATALLAAAPLLSALPQPARVRCDDPGTGDLLRRTCVTLDLPPVTPVTDAADLGPFERVLDGLLGLADRPPQRDPAGPPSVDLARRRDFTAWAHRVDVPTSDGAVLPTWYAGDRSRPAVLIASACGMPARLAERWVRRLARDHFVVVPQTRGLFAPDPAGRVDATTQADDLVTVLDHLRLDRAHVIGLCGGAVLAVVAAARRPDRVESLSLWHGDFDLGGESPKTDHQRNLQALMEMAARDENRAAAVHAVLAHTMLGVAPPGLAHLVVYPYVRPDLLHRYCRLNGAIMATDLRPYLTGLSPRTLVVTSRDDRTAHPDGSRAVAARIPGAALHVTEHGDHLSLFRAGDALMDLAVRFVAGDPPGPETPTLVGVGDDHEPPGGGVT